MNTEAITKASESKKRGGKKKITILEKIVLLFTCLIGLKDAITLLSVELFSLA